MNRTQSLKKISLFLLTTILSLESGFLFNSSYANPTASLAPAPGSSPSAATTPKAPTTALESAVAALSGSAFDISRGFSDLALRVLPGVVNVSSTQIIEERDRGAMGAMPFSPFDELFREFFDQQPQRPQKVQSAGSGFIIKIFQDPQSKKNQAYVVTNAHVVDNAKKVKVTLHSGTEVDAIVHGTDEKTDIAILKIDLSTVTDLSQIAALEFKEVQPSQARPKVGDWILAVGNPFGLGGTVTHGIVSSTQRDISLRGGKGGDYTDFIQHDAPLNVGNSGGPLIGLDGRVLGINVAIFSPSGGSVGIGFAIPYDLATKVIDQLLKSGRTTRGWLGLRIQPISKEMAKAFGTQYEGAAIVATVDPKGPGAIGGLQQGDVITHYNGQKVDLTHKLNRLVAETPPGTKVTLQVLRSGSIISLTFAVGELDPAVEGKPLLSQKRKHKEVKTKEILGITLSEFSSPESKKSDQEKASPPVKGLLVESVSPQSIAKETLLQKGDILLSVLGEENPLTLDQFEKIIEQAQKQKKTHLTLLIKKPSYHNPIGEDVYVTIPLQEETK